VGSVKNSIEIYYSLSDPVRLRCVNERMRSRLGVT
jgi:hypothetical protein